MSSPRLPRRRFRPLSSPRWPVAGGDLPGSEPESFPTWFVWGVVGVSVLPFACDLAGVGFDRPLAPATGTAPGVALHALLEWTSFCIAAFTVVLAVSHHHVKSDVTTPVIGAALCFSGLTDAFVTTAVLGLTVEVVDRVDFVPFTWMLSRTYNASILVAGTLPFLVDRRFAERVVARLDWRTMAGGSVVFALVSFAIVTVCARVPDLPPTIFPEAIMSRPWDVIPLIAYLVALGVVLPRFHALYPSLFAHGLVVSMVPCVFSECHAIGSSALYDHDFFAALVLKIVAYSIPLCGLVLDSAHAHESDVAFRITRDKLKFARSLQQSLLPQQPPDVAGFDLAGRSQPIEAVGGDYFDYLTDDEGRFGIVVADVSGHELAASIVLAQTRAYLRALAAMHERFGPMLTRLNHFLHEDLGDRWFVTLFFARVEPRTRSLDFAAAGHQAWLVRRDGTVILLEATCPPLGIVDGEVVTAAEEIALLPGDVLLVVSDGVLEALSPAGEAFGSERAVAVVRDHASRPAESIVDALFRTVDDFRRGAPQSDDVTVVAMRVT